MKTGRGWRRAPAGRRLVTQVVSSVATAAVGWLFLQGTAVAALPAPAPQTAGCMQDQAGFALNCSANDVRVSQVARRADGSPAIEIHDDGCAYPGDKVDFTATFEIVTTATSRYDIGVYFSTDLDEAQDGALTGSCAISALDASLTPDSTVTPPVKPAPDLDQDACGDSTKAGSPLYTTVTLSDVVCKDSDDDGYLDLPNCVSWRQTGANEVCDAVTDLYPGAPSKCNCNEGFDIPIVVPDAALLVTKEATPTKVNEPGDNVTYKITVVNTGVDPNNGVTLSTLVDDIYGDVTYKHGSIVSTTCDKYLNTYLDSKAKEGGTSSYSCQFVALTTGNAGDTVTDVVVANGMDDRGMGIDGQDDASVIIEGVNPSITVDKSPSKDEVLEPGANVTYTVKVTNTSVSSDPVTIKSMLDNRFGEIQKVAGNIISTTCALEQVIDSGKSYTCTFTAFVGGVVRSAHVNEVTVLAVDDEDKTATAKDTATVNIMNSPSSIDVTKTANPVSVQEPGAAVTYTVTVTNKSAVDTVTIDSLVDDQFGNLHGQGTCTVPKTLVPGGSFTCDFTGNVSGDAGDAHTNLVTASGKDDDNDPVSFSDDATVNITDVPPTVDVNKVAYKVLTYYKATVTNTSSVESVYLKSLTDDGKALTCSADVGETKCEVGLVLAAKASCSCLFQAEHYAPHVNTVLATVEDNDDGTAQDSDTAEVSFK